MNHNGEGPCRRMSPSFRSEGEKDSEREREREVVWWRGGQRAVFRLREPQMVSNDNAATDRGQGEEWGKRERGKRGARRGLDNADREAEVGRRKSGGHDEWERSEIQSGGNRKWIMFSWTCKIDTRMASPSPKCKPWRFVKSSLGCVPNPSQILSGKLTETT